MDGRAEPAAGPMADEDLVAAARTGSADAFGELYRAHAPRIARWARARASRDDAVVADVVQEVFTRALEHLDELRDPSRFRAWIYSIAEHVIVDHHRAARRVAPLDEDLALEVASPDVPPDLVAESRELARLLSRSAVGLSDRDALAITFASSRGLSSAELGRLLGVSPGAAKVLLHRARHRLRAALRLQVLLQRRGRDCAKLRSLVDLGEMTVAVRHVQRCDRCSAPDLELFGHGRVVRVPSARSPIAREVPKARLGNHSRTRG